MGVKDLERSYGNPLMSIPVPWVYVIAYCMGVGLRILFPYIAFAPGSAWRNALTGAGITLFIAGIFLAFWALFIFLKQNTTTVKFQSSSKLVTWGPFMFSRNPMYVGLSMAYVGEALVREDWWSLVLFAAMIAYLHFLVTRIEEKKLQSDFGSEYEAYRAKVRRWL